MADKGTIFLVLIGAMLFIMVQDRGGVDNLFSAQQPGTVGAGGTATEIITQTCSDPSNTLTVGPMQEWTNSGTDMSSENARVWIEGVDQGSQADQATLTVRNGEEVAVLHGYQSSTFYSEGTVFEMPCGPTSSAKQDGDSYKLWRHETSLTLTIANSDTGNNNDGSGTDNETIASGEEGLFEVDFRTSDTNAFSPPRHAFNPSGINIESFPKDGRSPTDSKGIAVVEFNGSMYDKTTVQWTGGNANSNKDNALLPDHHTLLNTDSETVVFSFDGCPVKGESRSCDYDLGTLRIKARSGENPTGDGDQDAGSLGLGDIRISYYAEDYEAHTEDSTVVFGTDQDDGTTSTFAVQHDWITVD